MTSYLSVQILSRTACRSAVFAAAARAGQRLRDERLGVTPGLKRAAKVAYTEILAPDSAPAWAFDRQALWNHVEAVEKRTNSQLARTIELALPVALSPADQIALLRHYILAAFVAHGMIADCAVHRRRPEPRAQVMLTMRSIGPNGFEQKNHDWNRRALLLAWRKTWAEHIHLALNTRAVDH